MSRVPGVVQLPNPINTISPTDFSYVKRRHMVITRQSLGGDHAPHRYYVLGWFRGSWPVALRGSSRLLVCGGGRREEGRPLHIPGCCGCQQGHLATGTGHALCGRPPSRCLMVFELSPEPSAAHAACFFLVLAPHSLPAHFGGLFVRVSCNGAG